AAMTIEDAAARAQSKSWIKATANRFVIKFHEALAQVSALLDQTNMQSADQYVAELKLWRVEAAVVKAKHVCLNWKRKEVRLFIPKSKMDQQ
ncbi:unnamed protein product, partial [Durusdinium trenchii]